jgi:hypothetical protein
MRSRTVKVAIENQKVDANLMLYASNYMGGKILLEAYERRRYQLYKIRLAKAQETASKDRSGYVVFAFDEDGKVEYNGACVYKNVTNGVHYDCDDFKGDLQGYLVKRGRNWVLSKTSDWIDGDGKVLTKNNPVPYQYQLSVVDGQRYRNTRYICADGSHVLDKNEASETYIAA